MLGLDKALGWMFRCCGISPSGSHIDKYFAISAIILIISVPLKRTVVLHVANGSTEGLYVTTMQFLSVFAAVGLIISNWMEPERYMNIMKDVESIGNQMKSSNDKRILKITCAMFGIIIVIQAAIYCQVSFYYAMYMFAVVTIVHCPCLQLIRVVHRIKNKFSALNDLVANIATDTSSASTELENVFHLHSSLHALVVDVDIHFGFYNLFSFVSKFIFFVFEMYVYLLSIENVSESLDFGLLVSFVKQIVFFISQVLVCHACSQEANRTVLLAHRVLHPDTPLDLWEQVGLFSALAVDNKVHFTVGGIFTLDRALITQTALTSLSYLIIAIQLREIKLF